MNYVTDLELACSYLGNPNEGGEYERGEDCLECAKDLIRLLRRDDASHFLRRTLGHISVLKTDLLPLFKQSVAKPEGGKARNKKHEKENEELFDILLRVLCNLTVPEETLFNGELPEEKTTRNFYILLQTYRRRYKEAFVDEAVWNVLSTKLGDLLRKEDRSEDDALTIERILVLVRNVLQVPRDVRSEKRTDDDATVHDQVLWVMRKSGIQELLLFMASSHGESQYCLHLLEIISLVFREQDPKHLARANFQRSKEERAEDENALVKLRQEEEAKKAAKFHETKSVRHSRFGGVFTVKNVKSISDRALIYHKPLSTVQDINFDKAKRPLKLAKNRLQPKDADNTTRRSTLAIRLFLKEFCLEFVNAAYNTLMRVVRDNLERQRAQKNDETYYLWAIRFFMEFNRVHKFRVELVTETMSTSTYYFIQQRIEDYKDNFEHEKKNRPMCLLYARRMHLGLRAVQELLMNLVAMSNSSTLSQPASVLKANILYEPEYRELCLTMFNIYQPEKFSLGFLRDLVETTHVLLKLMESMSKSGHMMVRSKKVVRKKKGGNKKEKAAKAKEETKKKNNEETWDNISGVISGLLQGNQEDISCDVSPFDAASDVPIDDQKATALFKVQDLLKSEKCSEAIGLLRAARQVWPENDAFGKGDDAEEEFMEIRQILFADVPRPKHLAPEQGEDPSGGGSPGEEDNYGGEDEEEEEDEEVVEQYVSKEQEFDFKAFLGRFTVKSVCSAYGNLLQNFRVNSAHTNHCIVKMLHRIAWECGQPAMLFHVAVFRAFQAIHKDYKLHPQDSSIKELNKFATFILGKFFETCDTNRKVFAELCFWKTSKEAHQIREGYDKDCGTASDRMKKSFWSEDMEDTLTRVFQQFKGGENQTTEEGQDILDAITAHFVESNKSRRQVAAKLKAMGLIQNTKEITRKPIRSKVQWSEEETEALTRLYNEFKEAFDPVARIREHLGTKKSSRQVIDKIMDLGLCDDRKKLKKSGGTRRRRGEGEMEKSASESDSALEDSSSEDDQGDDHDEDEMEEENVQEGGGGVKKSQQLVDLLKKMISPSRLDLSTDGIEVMAECLKWLKEVLGEEAEDREGGGDDGDDGAEDVPMVAVDSAVADVIRDNQDFKQLLKLIQMTPPANQQEQYWRIPSSLSATSLRAKEQALGKCLEIYRRSTAPKDPGEAAAESDVAGDLMDKFDIGQDDADNMACVVGAELPPTAASAVSGARKKKKEKRGPNKWMPMRRVVDEDLQRRLEEAIPTKSQKSNTTGETPKSQKKARKPAEKKGGRKKKKQATNLFEQYDQKSDSDEPAELSDKENNDDESIIDKVVSQEVQSDGDGGDAPTPSANRSRKFLDSSDESDAAEATPSRDKEKKRVKKSFLDSSSSDSDSSKKKTLKSGPKVDRAKGLLDSSSDEEATEAKNSKGRAKVDKKSVQKSMLESSSDSDGDSAKKPNEELETEEGHRSLVLEESSQSEKEESASKKKTAVLSDGDDSSSIAEPQKAKKTPAIESEEEDEVSQAPKTSTQRGVNKKRGRLASDSDSDSEDADLKKGGSGGAESGRSSRMSLNSEAEIPKKESPKKFSHRSRSSSSSSRSSMSSRFSSRSTSPTHWVTATPSKLEGTTNDSTLLESASKNSNPGSTTKSSAKKKKKRKMASSSSSENDESMKLKSGPPKSKNERKRSKVLSDDEDD